MRTIVVGGIHGAGKTFLCDALASRLGVQHFSASVVLTQAQKLPASVESNKAVSNIRGNQHLIVAKLRELAAGANLVILDGHFALLDTTESVRAVPVETFAHLSAIGLILLDTPAALAHRRIMQRDLSPIPLHLLEALHRAERAQAEQTSRNLGIPLLVIPDSDSIAAAECFVRDLQRLTPLATSDEICDHVNGWKNNG